MSPRRPVQYISCPAGSREFHQVVGPPCRGPTHAMPSGTWPPLQNFTTLSVDCPASNVPHPLPVKFGTSSGYIRNLGFPAEILSPDSITQGDSENSPLHTLWVTLNLLRRPNVSDHVSGPQVITGTHWSKIAAAGDALGVGDRERFSGHCRHELADGEQWVALRPIRTESGSKARCVPRAL